MTHAWLLYRRIVILALIFICPISALAQAEFDLLPDDLDPPPSVAPMTPRHMSSPTQQAKEAPVSDEPEKKKWWWPFGKSKAEKERDRPKTEEEIINVGPRQTATSNAPLLPLSVPLQTPQGILPTGFYQVYYTEGENQTRILKLVKQNQLMLQALARQTQTGGPVESVDPQKPHVLAESRLSPDHRSLILILKIGDTVFESDPIPTALETRKPLNY